MYIRDIIRKKREKQSLTEDEIRFFIFGYFKDEISEAQASALMTAMYIFGLNIKEIVYMIRAIAETGEELEFYRISNRITDIHTLGGVSDKITLMLLSVINALGIPATKVIGRELGMEDRLKSIPGYKIEGKVEKVKENLDKNNVVILKSIKNLAPIEEKLYKLRYNIACDSKIELIAISIMSQKIALGFYNIFFEITYGENAYVKTFSEAKMLAKYLQSIGNSLMRNVTCVVTPLNEHLGSSFGNLLELKEIYDFFNEKRDNQMEEVLLDFGGSILKNSKVCTDINKARKMIKEVVNNGSALNSFEKLVEGQGGNIDILKQEIKAKNIIPVMSERNGYISEIDVNKLRMLAKDLEAIRGKETDNIDVGAGIVFNKKVGDEVRVGEIVLYIYTNKDTKIESSVQKAKELVYISDKKVPKRRKVEFSI